MPDTIKLYMEAKRRETFLLVRGRIDEVTPAMVAAARRAEFDYH